MHGTGIAPAPLRESVKPVMTSARKRAAVDSLSPQIRPLGSQGNPPSEPMAAPSQETIWEARIQEAVLKAVMSLAPQVNHPIPGPPVYRPVAPSPMSAAALAEAEAAHTEQGLRLQEARKAQEQWAADMVRKAAEQAQKQADEAAQQAQEQARRDAEKAREIQSQLQRQLQALAAADAEAAQAFAEKRELLARESQAIAEKLQLLQQSTTGLAIQTAGHPMESATLPPHLLPSNNYQSSTPTYTSHQQGLAMPPNNAKGLAEPFNPAQPASAVPWNTATSIGSPRPEEASQE
jgi:hypothetical protein